MCPTVPDWGRRVHGISDLQYRCWLWKASNMRNGFRLCEDFAFWYRGKKIKKKLMIYISIWFCECIFLKNLLFYYLHKWLSARKKTRGFGKYDYCTLVEWRFYPFTKFYIGRISSISLNSVKVISTIVIW